MITPLLGQVVYFQKWLRASGYGYLESGVEKLDPGSALLEIARRAGVRGLRQDDSIDDTLPMIQDIIKLRCKPSK